MNQLPYKKRELQADSLTIGVNLDHPDQRLPDSSHSFAGLRPESLVPHRNILLRLRPCVAHFREIYGMHQSPKSTFSVGDQPQWL